MKGTMKEHSYGSRLEADYATLLDLRQKTGDIKGWLHEPVSIRLADNTFYRPDFMVLLLDDTVEFHEVKGFWREDARVKIKVAAEFFPAKFRAFTRVKGYWQEEEF
jgi:hypothetical protein